MQDPKVLERLGPGIWHSEHDLFMLGIHFRTRMTVLETGSGLLLHGPVPLDEAQAEALSGLGEVKYVVAPNSYHHLYAQAALERFPEARLWLGGALKRKRPELDGAVVSVGSEPAFGTTRSWLVDGMPKLDEILILHPESKTLVVADLVFNVLEYKRWLTGVVFRLTGTHKRLAQSRLFTWEMGDKQAYKASVEQVLDWDFTRVVMAHGEVLEGDAKSRLASALAM